MDKEKEEKDSTLNNCGFPVVLNDKYEYVTWMNGKKVGAWTREKTCEWMMSVPFQLKESNLTFIKSNKNKSSTQKEQQSHQFPTYLILHPQLKVWVIELFGYMYFSQHAYGEFIRTIPLKSHTNLIYIYALLSCWSNCEASQSIWHTLYKHTRPG